MIAGADGAGMTLEDSAFVETDAAPPRRTGRGRLIAAIVLLAFAAGATLAFWLATHVDTLPSWLRWSNAKPATVATPRLIVAGANPGDGSGAGRAAAAYPSVAEARIAALEERLAHISIEAQSASGNAARAEGLLVAFAARRALDNGQPLGYIEGQLRLRFGQAQPRAVATIINASREPVTVQDLRGGLDAIGPDLLGGGRDSGWWDAMKAQVGHLIVIRKATTPSPVPQQRLDRARRFVDAGRIDAALSEVWRMPGRAHADGWMQMARRYNEARRALDLIETAAILEPRYMRSSTGDQVATPSPLAP